MANIDRMPCRCQDHRWLHLACLLHWLHRQRQLITSQDLLRSDVSDQNNPQEDDRYHQPWHRLVGLEGGRQQAVARLDRKGHWEGLPRRVSIARCLHSQSECSTFDYFYCNLMLMSLLCAHFRWKSSRSQDSTCLNCWSCTVMAASRPSQQQQPPLRESQSSVPRATNHQSRLQSKHIRFQFTGTLDSCVAHNIRNEFNKFGAKKWEKNIQRCDNRNGKAEQCWWEKLWKVPAFFWVFIGLCCDETWNTMQIKSEAFGE